MTTGELILLPAGTIVLWHCSGPAKVGVVARDGWITWSNRAATRPTDGESLKYVSVEQAVEQA